MILQFKTYLTALLLFFAFFGKGEAGLFRQPFEKPLVTEVLSYGMTVHNMNHSVAFYSDVLMFKKVADFTVSGSHIDTLFGLSNVKVRIVRMRLGEEYLQLMEFLSEKGRAIPHHTASNDRMFQHIAIVVSNMEQAYLALLKKGISHISSMPQQLPYSNPDIGGIEAFYFKDPDNHPLELIHFPPDKGNPKWQKPMNRLFLGIDHTAITVDNTRKSLNFYHTLLGLKVTEKHFNEGLEQERLTNVKGAKVQITSLRAEYGPGIELIQYLYPTSGHDMPLDTKPNDIWHWQIQLNTPTMNKTYEEIMQANMRFLSRGAVHLKNPQFAFREAFIVLDPDGHGVLIVNP